MHHQWDNLVVWVDGEHEVLMFLQITPTIPQSASSYAGAQLATISTDRLISYSPANIFYPLRAFQNSLFPYDQTCRGF
jgi:hypothetical protein